jgi:hypothetical protein
MDKAIFSIAHYQTKPKNVGNTYISHCAKRRNFTVVERQKPRVTAGTEARPTYSSSEATR